MKPVVKVDMSSYKKWFSRKLEVTGKPIRDELYLEGRLLAIELINSTPPRNKKQGENAVKNDLERLFSQADTGFIDTVGAEHGLTNVDAWYARKARDGKLNLKWDRLDVNGQGMRQHHLRNVNNRGRVTRIIQHQFSESFGNVLEWRAKYVVSKEDFAAYLKKRQARVGSMRAGWLPSYYLCATHSPGGESPKNWVTVHASRARGLLGDVNDHSATRLGEKFIELFNYARGITKQFRDMPGGQMRSIVQWALRKRVVAMKRNINHILTGKTDRVSV